MDLTETEIESLEILKDQLCLPKFSTKVKTSTMSSLTTKGYARIVNHRGIEFWELTDKGLDYGTGK